MEATVEFNPPRPTNSVRLRIQDYADQPGRASVRIKDIPLNKTFMIGPETQSRWRRWIKRLAKLSLRRGGEAAMIGALLLAKQIGAEHGLGPEHTPLLIGAISSAVATSWKSEIGIGTHNFTITTGDVVKCALFTSSATLGASTTAYSATNEISGTGYTAAGTTIANATPTTSGTTAIYDWADASWSTATFTANGCVTYNSSKSNKAIFIVAFGSDQTVTAGTFTIQWPTADATNAIIRIA